TYGDDSQDRDEVAIGCCVAHPPEIIVVLIEEVTHITSMVIESLLISKASLVPTTSYIAKPAALWLNDFLVWVSSEAFGCCMKFTNASYCPPDDHVKLLLFLLP
ncbi:hypothetical protein Tco_1424836, partial [Tanacetum coccineum]